MSTFHCFLALLGSLLAGLAQAQNAPANVLINIQQKITWRTPTDSVRLLAVTLDRVRDNKQQAYCSYWAAFVQYQLALRAGKDRATTEAALNKGIKLLEDVPSKTVEHYALLSLLQGLNLKFANFLIIPFKAATVRENAELALALAPDNLRAHYARGITDYYTPKKYGGGKVAAAHFLKALAAPDKPDANPYAPNWGKADAYWYLAQTYQAAGQPDLARHYATQGLTAYPTNAWLRSLVAKL